jgi:phosphotransferase system HPr (HPr) family protein
MTGRMANPEPGPRGEAPEPVRPGRAPEAVAGPLRQLVRITNPLGLHMRAADRFHRAAKEFRATVVLRNGEAQADGKDLWALIILAVPPGAELVLEVDGPDAAVALPRLAEILGDPSGEDYAI